MKTKQEVTQAIANSQDGKLLKPTDTYSRFLLQLIHENSNYSVTNEGDEAMVDIEELVSNLEYAVHEFTNALEAVENFNK